MKQEAYNAIATSGKKEEKEVNKVSYKIAKREAKKAVMVAKNSMYESYVGD